MLPAPLGPHLAGFGGALLVPRRYTGSAPSRWSNRVFRNIAPPSSPQRSLATDRLGVAAVVFFIATAATPMTVVAGVVTTGFAMTGLVGIPVAFLAIGAVLMLFSVW